MNHTLALGSVEYKKYDVSYEAEVLEVFMEAFENYPLFFDIFKGHFKSEKKFRSLYEHLMKGIFKVTIRRDACYIGFVDGRVVDLVIVEAPTDKPVGFWDYALCGMMGVIIRLGLKNTLQFMNLSNRTEVVVKRIKEPRWHLYFLAVAPKHQGEGVGSDAIHNFVIPLLKKKCLNTMATLLATGLFEWIYRKDKYEF
ncbi:MAG: GNAT family N-acetyltransferase [Acetatifactor sp.]|nr:GNAT family N-acetyltransferase [Acetatifactor sp.]